MRMRSTLLPLCLLAASATMLCAQELPSEGPLPTTALINVQVRGNAPLDPHALELQVNGHATPITAVRSVSDGTTEVAILIDDGLRTSFGLQLNDMKQFITSLPPNVKVLIGYMQNGMVRSSGRFSNDHQEILSDLRIPTSIPGQSASPYFCLSDFVKRWPSNEPGARMVLMLTNGVDPYNGRPSVMNQDSPYVQDAQEDAQRAGVAVYSIYFPDAGFRGGMGSFSGQSYLQQVADATGGQSFNQTTITPPSIAPYLKEFGRAIQESYKLSFMAPPPRGKHNSMDELRVKSSQPGVKVHAPDAVRPGQTE